MDISRRIENHCFKAWYPTSQYTKISKVKFLLYYSNCVWTKSLSRLHYSYCNSRYAMCFIVNFISNFIFFYNTIEILIFQKKKKNFDLTKTYLKKVKTRYTMNFLTNQLDGSFYPRSFTLLHYDWFWDFALNRNK